VRDPIIENDLGLKIYAVGLGDRDEIDAEKLQSITNITNGYHQVSGSLTGEAVFDLEQFYFKIFANATDMELVADPIIFVSLGDTSPQFIDRATITSSDRSATFLILEIPEYREFYDLEFIGPHGTVIELGSAVAGVPVHRMQRYSYTIYKVVFPSAEEAPLYTGDWTLWATPNGSWQPAQSAATLTANIPPTGMVMWNPGLGSVPVGFGAAVTTDYRLSVDLLPSSYLTGAQVTMTAALIDRGMPVTDATVSVTVTTPGGTSYPSISLRDDGVNGDVAANDGTWTGRFLQTGEHGSYRFFFDALGHNAERELTPRQATRYLTLGSPMTEPEDEAEAEPCIPCSVQWWLWAIALLLLLFLVWCCIRGRNYRTTTG
jgi:hypothetical protein